VPIEVGAVRIRPGDILFGDVDGVVLVSKEVETEVFRLAVEKTHGEKSLKTELCEGLPAAAAFSKYGIM
jgi:regulator of RNase E activity RraA